MSQTKNVPSLTTYNNHFLDLWAVMQNGIYSCLLESVGSLTERVSVFVDARIDVSMAPIVGFVGVGWAAELIV